MKVYLGEFEDEIDKEIILKNILKKSVPIKVLNCNTFYCPICNEIVENDSKHVSFCRDEQTDMYIYCLKERVKNYNYKALCFLSLLDFSGLN
jgi:ferredoxin